MYRLIMMAGEPDEPDPAEPDNNSSDSLVDSGQGNNVHAVSNG